MKSRLVKRFSALFLLSGMLVGESSGILASSEKDAIRLANRRKADSSSVITLKVYNSEDYIAEDEKDDNGNITSKGILSEFEEYEKDKGKNVRVSYSCFDTNEDMLSQLKMGSQYDLVCTSDYVVQKMIRQDMVVPFESDSSWEEENFSSTPNYNDYCSPFIKNKIKGISVMKDGKTVDVNQYARGYMWGTLGILYNSDFVKLSERGISSDEIDSDMTDWLSLWDGKYKNLFTIKDSMRDTYAVGVMKAFSDEFEALGKQFEDKELTEAEYNSKVHGIFNRCDDESIQKVEKVLEELRDNAYGFEVDGGKVDMARGLYYAINLAWSGDATWAMDMADEYNAKHEGEKNFKPTELKYAIPKTGANVWFDAWVMPNSVKDSGNQEIATEFIDFLSDPEIAAQNMAFIGYTPVIAGDPILEYVRESYGDVRAEEDDDGNITWNEEADLDGTYAKSLKYFFQGTLSDENEADIDKATTFYLPEDCRYKQFDTAYPDESLLPELVIMDDYGDQNGKVVKMWTRVKAKMLPAWVYYTVLAIVLILIGIGIFCGINSQRKKALRKSRHLERVERARKSRSLTKDLTEGVAVSPIPPEAAITDKKD